jgi:Na+/melibiose symporter-like transporter
MIGLQSGTAGHGAAITAADLSHSAITWIGIIYGPGTSMLALAAALVCLFYRLEANTYRTILDELAVGRAAFAPPSSSACRYCSQIGWIEDDDPYPAIQR